ncbi:hypothetical protein [Salinivibrio sp. ES.052]|uniref:hypothetical protein n=1 Tax=Salinivibrio sp. ES.052 TaxID=1882823 RepID=UPI000927BA45|nr:hypothetical protein [Salinivibrio sp. ES.052]SIO06685.1 hypothetical protein SAMN05444724_1903 [Salinivibrio sp. ES.052]SIO40736.1 hypothetical protein SAMN05444724_3232 [Salinivibrio sp. ES.052]
MPKLNKHQQAVIRAMQAGHWFELCADYRVNQAGYIGATGFDMKLNPRTVFKLYREKLITYRTTYPYGIKWYVFELTPAGRALDVSHS